jgi:hypothetical protein
VTAPPNGESFSQINKIVNKIVKLRVRLVRSGGLLSHSPERRSLCKRHSRLVLHAPNTKVKAATAIAKSYDGGGVAIT